MSRLARPRRRTRNGFQAYYHSPVWYARRAQIVVRAAGRCEYCRLQPVQHVHHRTYARFGHEPLMDLMAVCAACHRRIHRRGRRGLCAPGSLRAQGDTGWGHPAVWRQYLATCRGEGHARRRHTPARTG